MRYLSISFVALAFALVSYSAMADCPGHGVAQKPTATTVATADGAAPQSTKVRIPDSKSGS